MDSKKDIITKEKIVIYDHSKPGGKVIRDIEIHTNNGELKKYVLRKTSKGGYLFN